MKAAIEFADKSLATLQPLLAVTPLSENVKSLARDNHWGRAVALDKLNQYPEAVEAWSEVIGLSSTNNKSVPRAFRSITRA